MKTPLLDMDKCSILYIMQCVGSALHIRDIVRKSHVRLTIREVSSKLKTLEEDGFVSSVPEEGEIDLERNIIPTRLFFLTSKGMEAQVDRSKRILPFTPQIAAI